MLKDFYDDSKEIISLDVFYGPKKHLVNKCLVIFSKEIYDHINQEYETKDIAIMTGCNGNIPIKSFIYNNEEIGFYLSNIGSALAGCGVYEVSHLIGANKFVMFGSCGVLDKNKVNNKFIIPTESYRGEGMSYYFKEASDYINIKNSNIVKDIFDKYHIPYVAGKIWTTDCMLRETVNLVNKRKEEGCIAVEMELAGVEATCQFYNLELYDFLAPGDIVCEDNYDINELKDANHNLDKFKIALKIIEEI